MTLSHSPSCANRPGCSECLALPVSAARLRYRRIRLNLSTQAPRMEQQNARSQGALRNHLT